MIMLQLANPFEILLGFRVGYIEHKRHGCCWNARFHIDPLRAVLINANVLI